MKGLGGGGGGGGSLKRNKQEEIVTSWPNPEKKKTPPGLWGRSAGNPWDNIIYNRLRGFQTPEEFEKEFTIPSDKEHSEKLPNMLEYSTEAVPVEAWEVQREAIVPKLESGDSEVSHTWVVGFLYINKEELKVRVYHKCILKEGQYHINPSQYRQVFSCQKVLEL